MKILKSYYKTPSFLTGRCIVSLAILGLISCSDRNGKSLSEATNDPAGIYREYLYNIRRQKGEYPLPVIELENGLAVVPSCLDLSAAESELINEPGRELILKGLITKLLDSRKFDYILIDCPPSLGLLTLNALTTADFLIIPVQAQFLAMRGMAKITSVIEIVKERLNPNLSIGGIVITQFDKRKTLNKSVAEIINDSFCDKVFKTIVRDNVALAEAPIKGKNVFEYNKNCNGAKDYMALAQEVLKLK